MTEDEANFVPAEILEEEERLRRKREGENKEALKVLIVSSTNFGIAQSQITYAAEPWITCMAGLVISFTGASRIISCGSEGRLSVQNIFNTGTEDGALDKGNFSKLDNLIVQTGHYSAFLFEQMKASLSPTFSCSNEESGLVELCSTIAE